MKEGWTYKKLGEVCVDKKQIVRASNLFLPNEIINYIDISSIDNSQNVITSTTPIFFDDAPSRAQQVVKIGDVLISLVRPNLRNVAIVNSQNDNLVASSGFCILRTEGHVNNRYIFYIVKGDKFTNYLLSRVQGANYPAVREDDIKNYLLPVPPIAEQERIVAELDLLSGIIEKKKEQLKTYDQLAQSIFYTMFGDPIDNPKGLETKKLKELCKKITDGTHNSPINTEIGDYKYITAKNIKKDGIILNNITYVSTDIHKAIYERCNPEYGDVLYIKDGITTGIATINTLKEEFSLLSSVALLKPKGCLMNYYLKAVLNMPSQYASIREHMGGAAITRLTIAKINEIRIPVPPLSLQEEFAEKVEAIERQKALVQQSIDETQTMFDFTMDKYFG